MAVRPPKGNRPVRSTAASAPPAPAPGGSSGFGSGLGTASAAGSGAGAGSEPGSDDLLEAAAELAGDIGAAELTRRMADNIRALRKARGYSLDDMARRSGVSRASLSQVETAKTNPTIAILWKIAAGLEVPFSALLGEDNAERSQRAAAARPAGPEVGRRALREPPADPGGGAHRRRQVAGAAPPL